MRTWGKTVFSTPRRKARRNAARLGLGVRPWSGRPGTGTRVACKTTFRGRDQWAATRRVTNSRLTAWIVKINETL